MTRLSDKLRALGVELGTASLQTNNSAISRLHETIPGEYTHDDLVFETIETFNADYLHGIYPLWRNLFDQLQSLINMQFNLQDLVFIDAETTGLSGGTGTFVFMLGLGWFDTSNTFHVKQLFMPEPSCENNYLTALSETMANFKTLVSFNGKSFDIPLIKTRYVLHAIPSPFEDMSHIDLLHLSRRAWRYKLASRTLGELEKHILHFSRSEVELPGWMAPKLYLDYLQTKDAAPMKGMFYHNQVDIVSLAALLCVLEKMAGLDCDSAAETIAMAEYFEQLGNKPNAITAYKKTIEMDSDGIFTAQANHRLGAIYRRAEDWGSAISCWMQSAITRPASCIELAKYYEHQVHDYNEAEHWCKFALTLTNQTDRIEEIEYRLKRLSRKKKSNQEQNHDE